MNTHTHTQIKNDIFWGVAGKDWRSKQIYSGTSGLEISTPGIASRLQSTPVTKAQQQKCANQLGLELVSIGGVTNTGGLFNTEFFDINTIGLTNENAKSKKDQFKMCVQRYATENALQEQKRRAKLEKARMMVDAQREAEQKERDKQKSLKQSACASKLGLDASMIDPAFRQSVRLGPELAAKLQAFDECVASPTFDVATPTPEPTPTPTPEPTPAPKRDIFGIKPMYFFGGLAALAITVAIIKK